MIVTMHIYLYIDKAKNKLIFLLVIIFVLLRQFKSLSRTKAHI